MNPTNRSDVEKFFRNQPLYKMATTIKEIEKNLWQYSSHELDWDNEILSVDYSIGNTDEFDSKDYPMQEFLDWCEENCNNPGDWYREDRDKDDVSDLYFDVEAYIENNETALVKEFFNVNK